MTCDSVYSKGTKGNTISLGWPHLQWFTQCP